MQLGLSSYTFGWAVGMPGHAPTRPLDEHGLLDKCREHGVKLLQIGDNLPLHTFDEARLAAFAANANGEGAPPVRSAEHCSARTEASRESVFGSARQFARSDAPRSGRVQLEVGARRLVPERVAEYARIARRLNARLIRFVIDDTGFHPPPDEVTATLKKCAPLLDGLRLGIENHDRFPAATLREMIERAGDERIGVCLDTANSLGAGEGIDVVAETLAPLVLNLHVKDFHIARVPHLMGFTVSGRPAGGGFLDVPRLLKQLAPARRCETAVLELWTPPEPRLEDTIAKEAAWAAQSLNYLKPFFTI